MRGIINIMYEGNEKETRTRVTGGSWTIASITACSSGLVAKRVKCIA